ncbi:FG-GAP repeat domain-containing protein [Paenibacillus sp. IITD108]|uniref:FG-GAP repeat domain-containing protein n=1 Tax=Paenibacillus sp. IITD108 TaxID=3116649 RepID=UPI002F40E265
MNIEHKGLEQFLKGTFGNGGDNLFVDVAGTIRRIMDNDLNNNGLFDIVLPNTHGYIERAPTYIYTEKEGDWEKFQLPHDSGWLPKAIDVDGDGYLDLIIANSENGVTSELKSYIYWGGPNGLTGECTELDTIGAYDVAVFDINGDGLNDLIFTTAWYDHHNAGVPLHQKVYVQTAPRQFVDVTEKYKIPGLATVSLICEDLNGDGYPDLALVNLRDQYNYDIESVVYWGTPKGFDTDNPVRLPTRHAGQVLAADLNGDGRKELLFAGGNQLIIYWNDNGSFSAENRLVLDIAGMTGQFVKGMLTTDIADIDNDGIPELVIATLEGVEIRKANDLEHVWMKLPCYGCSWVKAADIRNTGRIDIIASHYCSSTAYDTVSLVFWNSEDGYSLDNVTSFETHGPMGCTAADLDNDGVKEIIFCNTMKGPSQMDPNFPVFVYYGTPDHQYKAENRKDYPVNIMCHTYAVADVDNDGFVELIVTTVEGIRIFQGTADGPDSSNYYDVIHPACEKYGLSHIVGGVMVGDFNRDGWLDLIVVPWVMRNTEEELSHSVVVYYGGPNGYSNDRRMILPAYTRISQAILLADINNDGYIDFLYGDGEGSIGVYYGGTEGFNKERYGKIRLKDYNGALIMGLATADIDKDGWLELIVTTAGHYTRLSSHVYVLRNGNEGFPEESTFMFETGGTTGFPALADMTGSGNLDLLLPFYSTTETRELPARIFRGDGKGNFDWERPEMIDCLSSIAFTPVDLNGNGYPDLFICCHRNDLGHIVNSKLIMNGPDGIDIENAQDILGYGPHNFTAKNQGNAMDRSDNEHYISPVFACDRPQRIEWQGETPFKTSLSFHVRFGHSEEEVKGSVWSESIVDSGSALHAPQNAKYMQYKVEFRAPGLVSSPKLTSVTIKS